MMNLARVETLSRARAVLNADIDELIVSETGASVFDAAVRRRPIPVKIGRAPTGTVAARLNEAVRA